MARIETYPFDLAPSVNDYVIGTDGDNLNATRNYKVMTFLDYLGTQYNLNSTDMLFQYDDVISTAVGNGYVSTNNYADATILMSGVTNIYVSKLTGFGVLVEAALNSLGTNGLSIMFADMGNRNNYGLFTVVSAVDVDANTINLTVTATATLGTLSAGKAMGIRVGVGGGGGDFVDFISDETITGIKTFESAVATQSVYSNTNGRTTAIGQGATFNIQASAGAGMDFRVNGDATDSLYINTNGSVKLTNLAGVGERMVIADATGLLSTQAIPSGGSTGGIVGFDDTSFTNALTGSWEEAATLSSAIGLMANDGDVVKIRVGGRMNGAGSGSGTKSINVKVDLDAGAQGLTTTNFINVVWNGIWVIDTMITRVSSTSFIINGWATYYTTTGGTSRTLPSVGVSGSALTFATSAIVVTVDISSTVVSTLTYDNMTVEYIPAL
jgi:hypothetical protein